MVPAKLRAVGFAVMVTLDETMRLTLNDRGAVPLAGVTVIVALYVLGGLLPTCACKTNWPGADAGALKPSHGTLEGEVEIEMPI